MNLCLGEDGGGLGPEVAAFLAHQREPFRVVPSRVLDLGHLGDLDAHLLAEGSRGGAR